VTGGSHLQSRSRILGEAIASRIQSRLATERVDVGIDTLVPEFGAAQRRQGVTARVEQALQQIEHAELLVVVTPVYKGSYSGHFKHLFDLVDAGALVGTPVALAATGGGERHALMVEHQLRPLFGFFRAQTLPTAVYASEAEFDGLAIRSQVVLARVDAVAAEAVGVARFAQAVNGAPSNSVHMRELSVPAWVRLPTMPSSPQRESEE
jgi:FMN reductase